MKFIRILLLLLMLTPAMYSQHITDYVSFTGIGIKAGDHKEVICLRRFFKDNHCFYFTVSPESLNTCIIRSDSIAIISLSWELIRFLCSSTTYIHALEQAEKLSNVLQDAGYTHFMSIKNGIDLTIDLCPSARPLDRIVFTNLINELGIAEKPVPVAIAITGKWISNHPGDLSWLDSLEKSGSLSIVWINHSFNHYTYKDVPLGINFLLAPGTDINAEIMNTEIILLEKNIQPSVFFRFPGLVSDTKTYQEILEKGLIPVGSDAWLAKGQWPKNGSIVLIHANGNEPVGVKDFIELLKIKREDLLSKRWELLDLRESLARFETRK